MVDESGGGLEGHITREMNRPFGEGVGRSRRGGNRVVMPFGRSSCGSGVRGKATHFLGVVYAHWVADSVAMRMVMREWFCRLFDAGAVRKGGLREPEGGFWRYFGPERCGWNLMDGVSGLAESMSDFSPARRLAKASDEAGHAVECTFHQLPDGMVESPVQAARRGRKWGHGVTLNDMILAALARAVDAHGAVPGGGGETRARTRRSGDGDDCGFAGDDAGRHGGCVWDVPGVHVGGGAAGDAAGPGKAAGVVRA